MSSPATVTGACQSLLQKHALTMPVSLALIVICGLLRSVASTDTPEDVDDQFRLTSKSPASSAVVARVGDTVHMSCRTNRPWQLCSWQRPPTPASADAAKGIEGDWCHRLSTSKYTTSCQGHKRIRYQQAFHPPSSSGSYSPDLDCSIVIVDLTTDDNGKWRCLVKEHVHSDAPGQEEVLELTVAKPYVLSLDPAQPVLDGGPGSGRAPPQETSTSTSTPDAEDGVEEVPEVVCMAKGSGGVDPVLEWQVDGKPVLARQTHTWQEVHSSGYKVIYLALALNETLYELSDNTMLRCLSKQLFPNGTIIFESSIVTHLRVIGGEVETGARSSPQSQSSLVGPIFTGIIVFLTMLAIILIYYSKKYKKWCYAKPDFSNCGANANSSPEAEVAEEAEIQLFIEVGEPTSSQTGAQNHTQNNQSTPRVSQSSAAVFPPPPVSPVSLDSDPTPDFSRPTTPTSNPDPNTARLVELITAPPPIPAQSADPPSKRWSLQDAVAGHLPPRLQTTFSMPEPPPSLSEGLTLNRSARSRRQNDYVKVWSSPSQTSLTARQSDIEDDGDAGRPEAIAVTATIHDYANRSVEEEEDERTNTNANTSSRSSSISEEERTLAALMPSNRPGETSL